MYDYCRKHVRLIGPYLKLGWREVTEYKFNFITNTLNYVIFIILWVAFWSLMTGKLGAIGEWTNPMLIMLVGFAFFNHALWQFTFGTVMIVEDVMDGQLDNYLIRPINPLYALVMKRLSVMDILPALFGLGIILYAIFAYFSLNVLALMLGLMITVLAVVIMQFLFMLAGASVFWFGRNKAFYRLIRSCDPINEYPVNIFGMVAVNFLTFVIPKVFIGTYPVMLLAGKPLSWGLKIFALELGIAAFWGAALYIIWNRGLRRYESHGG
jgi:ABC-2 type transport system permease protein